MDFLGERQNGTPFCAPAWALVSHLCRTLPLTGIFPRRTLPFTVRYDCFMSLWLLTLDTPQANKNNAKKKLKPYFIGVLVPNALRRVWAKRARLVTESESRRRPAARGYAALSVF